MNKKNILIIVLCVLLSLLLLIRIHTKPNAIVIKNNHYNKGLTLELDEYSGVLRGYFYEFERKEWKKIEITNDFLVIYLDDITLYISLEHVLNYTVYK